MHVLLIFPPQCRPLHPALGLPLIKTELLRRGHICKVVDLNIRFYNHVLNSVTLRAILERISSKLIILEESISLNGTKLIQFARMTSAKIRANYVIENIDRTVEIFRGDDFYDLGKFLWARKIAEEAMELYSCAFGHTDIGISQYRMRYGTSAPSDILKATEDREENPFVDLLKEWTDEEIESYKPEVIGISFMLDEQFIPGFTLARQLKTSWKGLLVAGGSMITRLRKELPHEPIFSEIFDYYLPYESERHLGEFIDEQEGKFIKHPVVFTELCPDFDDLPLDKYLLPDLILPFQSGRGCSFAKCFYCSHYKTYNRYQYGDPQKAAKHLKHLSKKYNCKHFYFVDEDIVPKFGYDLSEALIQNEANIRWMVFGRLHKAWNEEIVKKIAEAGCKRLIFGLDGATDRIQKLMNKHTDLDYAGHILKICAREKIALQINIIVGYPEEEEWEARKALNFLTKNRDALLTLGSCIAMSNFVLVREAAWGKMRITPIIDEKKRFANYYAYETPNGLTMQDIPKLAHRLQLEADRMLAASWRFPILREFAFLYRDRYGDSEEIPKTTDYPIPKSETHWSFYNVRDIFEQINHAKNALPVCPMEHISDWWRIASESNLIANRSDSLFGYQIGVRFNENTFELPIIEAFIWETKEKISR